MREKIEVIYRKYFLLYEEPFDCNTNYVTDRKVLIMEGKDLGDDLDQEDQCIYCCGIYTGEVKGGQMNGKGRLNHTYEIKEGEWLNGMLHGNVKIFNDKKELEFIGEFKDGYKDGFGKYFTIDGDILEGQFKEGKAVFGKYIYSNGNVYEGEMEYDHPGGNGKLSFVNGSIYEGQVNDDMPINFGKMTYNDGVIYEGEWREGEEFGKGKYIYQDGIVYQGIWNENEKVNEINFEKVAVNRKELEMYRGKKIAKRIDKLWTEEVTDEDVDETYLTEEYKIIFRPNSILDSDAIEILLENEIDFIYIQCEKTNRTERINQISQTNELKNEIKVYNLPYLNLFVENDITDEFLNSKEIEENKKKIVNTLEIFKIPIETISATVGPSVTLYEIIQKKGVRISSVRALEDDIAMSLATSGIRIIAPIPGKGTIGIEIPNSEKSIVTLKSILSTKEYQECNYSLPLAIGKRIDNTPYIIDLATMPHLLIAGATGQGKSVGINTLLISLLFKLPPEKLKLILIDPKQVELNLYRPIENNYLAKIPSQNNPIIIDTEKVIATLTSLCEEMENRFSLLNHAKCRNIEEYNLKFNNAELKKDDGHKYFPFIVLVIDEFADLIMTAGKDIVLPISRLAQKARAVGIHLIIATQRPSVKIITGEIKANFPTMIAFKLFSQVDSRTILDVKGADQLAGKGDMLISNDGEITRVQCAFVSTAEVVRVCEFIGKQAIGNEPYYLP